MLGMAGKSNLPTILCVKFVCALSVVKGPIEERFVQIRPSVYNQEIQTEFLSQQEFGVTDTGFSLTGTFDFHEEGRGIEPPGITPARLSRPLANHLALPSIDFLGSVSTLAFASPWQRSRKSETHVGIEPTLRLLCRQPLTASEAMDQS
jgi:hypothetical protein